MGLEVHTKVVQDIILSAVPSFQECQFAGNRDIKKNDTHWQNNMTDWFTELCINGQVSVFSFYRYGVILITECYAHVYFVHVHFSFVASQPHCGHVAPPLQGGRRAGNIEAAPWQNQLNDARPAKTQIRLHIWSESSLCARTQGFFMRTAKTDQTGCVPRLIWRSSLGTKVVHINIHEHRLDNAMF